ncbi:unnamed protein product [Nippostrongylus brasiliensis]|uniref:Alkaline phosphatase n=1 Tax=Nippostrongylus brasiliensis TaxID=27835 RepID=A0A0N4XCW8_NIPBR|nr:hypothetical protein Q1695_008560 [Nippostrongylus brasiliensis]VDL62806.1 unnamed protein product [Nippostrongylus brasiliensis]
MTWYSNETFQASEPLPRTPSVDEFSVAYRGGVAVDAPLKQYGGIHADNDVEYFSTVATCAAIANDFMIVNKLRRYLNDSTRQ